MKIGNWAEWAAAIFTGGAIFTALYQVRNERNVRLEEQKADTERKKRYQAEHVSAWYPREIEAPLTWAAVQNHATEPVFQVVVSVVGIQGAGPPQKSPIMDNYPYRAFLSCLPSGRYYIRIPHGGGGMMKRFGLEVAFSDAAGRHWIRYGTGALESLPVDAPTYYQVRRPIGWEYATTDTLPLNP